MEFLGNQKPTLETINNNMMSTTEKLNTQEKPKNNLDFTCIMLDKRGKKKSSKRFHFGN